MPIILVQDFSGASLPGGLQADDYTLQGNTRDDTARCQGGRTAAGTRANSYRLKRLYFTVPGTFPLDPVPNTCWACSRAPGEEPSLKSFSIQNRTSAHTTERMTLMTEAN